MEVHLRGNQLSSLEEYACEFLIARNYIKYISLRDNEFETFPVQLTIFQNLTALSLSKNHLHEIPQGVFPEMNALQWLNLGYNSLKDLPNDIVYCQHLRGIELSNNQLSEIPKVLFKMKTIEELSLQNNQIKSIPNTCVLPSNLKTLNLSFNQLTSIPLAFIFLVPDYLSALLLSGNPLGHLPNNFLATGYHHLCCLDLHSCKLNSLSPTFFNNLARISRLKRLNIAINKLKAIPEEIGKLISLQWLNLNDNQLTELPETLTRLSCLVKIGLAQNQLEQLPPFMFMHMISLEKIDVRSNRLRYLPPSMLGLIRAAEMDLNPETAVPPRVVFKSSHQPQCLLECCGICELRYHEVCGSLKSISYGGNHDMALLDGIFADDNQLISLSDAYRLLDTIDTNGIIWDTERQKLNDTLLAEIYSSFNTQPIIPRGSVFPTTGDRHVPGSDESLAELPDDNDHDIVLSHVAIPVPPALIAPRHPHEEKNPMQLREICLKAFLNKRSCHFLHHLLHPGERLRSNDSSMPLRIDQQRPTLVKFLDYAIGSNCLPMLIQDDIARKAVQCDHCNTWYTTSNYQVAYLDRLGSTEVPCPLRFSVCSLYCAVRAVVRLYLEHRRMAE
ncbi:MAG: hypothetical protein EXX96DRAFT_481005 [Benjaminiella poitrasii]|nr:MAG: hypothetical protein EXX96DRAFT_481005 [Benjaminiella poitrasii]